MIKQKMGRPVTEKTARVRRAVRGAMRNHGFDSSNKPVALSTVDIARLARQGKTATVFALRYFENVGLVERCSYRADASGVGQPPQMWKATHDINE